jgi:hypothetical protein
MEGVASKSQVRTLGSQDSKSGASRMGQNPTRAENCSMTPLTTTPAAAVQPSPAPGFA